MVGRPEVAFTLDIEGEERLPPMMLAIRDRVDLREARRDLDSVIHNVVRNQFAGEGNAGRHGRWPGLAPSTRAQKAARGRGGLPMLVDSGRMRRAAVSKRGGGDGVRRASRLRYEWGLAGRSGRIGRYHQFGTRRMQQRRLFDLRDEDVKRMVNAVRRSLLSAIGP